MAGEKDSRESKSSHDKVGPGNDKQIADNSATRASGNNGDSSQLYTGPYATGGEALFDLPEAYDYQDLRPSDWANIIYNWEECTLEMFNEISRECGPERVGSLSKKFRFEEKTRLIRVAMEERDIASKSVDSIYWLLDGYATGFGFDSEKWGESYLESILSLNRLKAKIAPAGYAELHGTKPDANASPGREALHGVTTGASGPEESSAHITGAIAQPPKYVYRREGDLWAITFEGKTTHLKGSKGSSYISYLLANPLKPITAYDLKLQVDAALLRRERASSQQIVDKEQEDAALLRHERASFQQIVDKEGFESYRDEYRRLQRELQQARESKDAPKEERILKDMNDLGEAILKATGLGNRVREFAGPNERARKSVTNAIRRTLKKIKSLNTHLCQHLTNSLQIRETLVYNPDRDIPWEF